LRGGAAEPVGDGQWNLVVAPLGEFLERDLTLDRNARHTVAGIAGKHISRTLPAILLAIPLVAQADPAADKTVSGHTSETPPQSRSFEFRYGTVIKELPSGARIRVWIPVPQANAHQSVRRIGGELPFPVQLTTERKYGNKMLYMDGRVSNKTSLEISVAYRVRRTEVLGLVTRDRVKLTDSQRKLFLANSARVPTDGKPVRLLADLDLPKHDALKLGHVLYDKVERHMSYDKSRPGYGTGDAVWACDSRYGNCTDFHSLFISLSRSQGIPSRFEIGFPLPGKRGAGEIGGYHCWAFFHTQKQGWLPVDISEADKHPEMKDYYFGNLTENRITFTVGRDLTLTPPQDGDPLNYFIYPHVEVDGTVWPRTKMRKQFRFEDI